MATGRVRRAGLGIALVLLWGCGERTPSISSAELVSRLGSPSAPLVLDVRSPEEFASGHVTGALNIPLAEIPGRLAELEASRDRELVVYCERGPRAMRALEVLADSGFRELRHLDGDMSGWRSERLPCMGC